MMNLSNDVYLDAGSQPMTRPIGPGLSERIQHFRAAWAERRARARQIQELYHSTDRELWDMGLSRSDLPEIAKGTYHRD